MSKFIVVLMVGLFFVQPVFGQVQIHVALNGDDSAAGTADAPLATLKAARDLIRDQRRQSQWTDEAIEVLIHAGRYSLPATLEFTSVDSGTLEHPVLYRAVDGDVTLSGGVTLSDWQPLDRDALIQQLPVVARGKVLAIDLAAQGLDAGQLHARRWHQPMAVEPMELFSNGLALPRAQWPNEGWSTTREVHDRSWTSDRIAGLPLRDVWAQGFWQHDWMDSFEPVTIESGRLQLTSHDPQAPANIRQGARYRLCNLISELDSAGEWYFDAPSGYLVYWPSTDEDLVQASVLETVLSLYDVEHVQFEGCRIETARATAVEIVGGSHVTFTGCTLAQAGNVCLHIFGGSDHRIENCEIFCAGSSAVRVEAGDRKTLTPAGHVIENCDIADFGRLFSSGRAGVALYGVGNVVRRCYVHDGPDSAIALFGNEHRLEGNEITSVCRETADCAAVHLSYDPSYRGNVIDRNFIHDIGGFSNRDVFGIYLDDFASGTEVTRNYIRNVARGIGIGGGRDNQIIGNVLAENLAAIQIDARGTTWARDQVLGPDTRIQRLLEDLRVSAPALLEHYPELSTMLDDHPELPQGNRIRDNRFDSRIGIDVQGFDARIIELENNSRQDAKAVSQWIERD